MRQGKVSIASCPAQVKTQIDPTGEDKHEATKDEPTDGNKDEPTGEYKRCPRKWRAQN